ncbi:MAG: glycine cleavage system protein GcvH [Chitinivibrionales bacterium]|nr:glycine cleavage system protein GcvH [Chitinivibrionales bacterium]
MVPQDCKYTKSHEWVKLEGDTATVGITDHAQDSLGDITYVELPSPGTKVEKGKECGVIESVKAASDLYSPVSGEVIEQNGALEDAPEAINKAAHGDGWLFKLKGVSQDEVNELMDAQAYESFLESEA